MVEGTLNLSGKGVDYIIFCRGNSYNLTKNFEAMLRQKVAMQIEDRDGIVFKGIGRLTCKKIDGDLYKYFVGKTSIDDILWDRVGERIKIGYKCIGSEEVTQS
jgi:hypothetical protein